VLAGPCVLYPSHSAPLLPPDGIVFTELVDSGIVGQPKMMRYNGWSLLFAGKPPLRSRRTPSASGRTLSAGAPVRHTDPRSAALPPDAASEWRLFFRRQLPVCRPLGVDATLVNSAVFIIANLRSVRSESSPVTPRLTCLGVQTRMLENRRLRSSLRRLCLALSDKPKIVRTGRAESAPGPSCVVPSFAACWPCTSHSRWRRERSSFSISTNRWS
jgi:hypothetical protein